MYVCSDAMDELVVTFTSLSGDSADKFINEYLEGNVYKGNGVPYETFKLRITSEEYKWLYYILYLVRCDNGDYYVYGATDRTGYTVDPTFFHASLGGAVK